MSLLDHLREAYEHEKDADEKILAMLESIPSDRRSEALFHRAVRTG